MLKKSEHLAAVSCSSGVPWLGGVKMGLGLMGKLGRAWVLHGCMGVAWVHGWVMVMMMWWVCEIHNIYPTPYYLEKINQVLF